MQRGDVALGVDGQEVFAGGCSTNALSLAAAAGLHLSDVRAEVREWNSAFTLVRENIGVSLVPEMTLPANRQGLRVVPLIPQIIREFALVTGTRDAPSAAVQALLSILADQ
ncbi:DNA-binding transcriptional LysR family regulator [Pseudomonas frederiksbergensis]